MVTAFQPWVCMQPCAASEPQTSAWSVFVLHQTANHGAFVFLRLSAMFECDRAVTVCDQVLEAVRPYSIASSG